MRNIIALLFALIVAPAWAADTPVDTMPTADPTASIVIKLTGAANDVKAFIIAFESDAVYKSADCKTSTTGKSKKSATVACKQADGALMSYLVSNASALQWSVSSSKSLRNKENDKATAMCVSPCTWRACPRSTDPQACCKMVNNRWQVCTSTTQ